MTAVRRSVGAWGEERAVAHLTAQGMVVLDRNWRCRRGEIDIVALDGETVVFVEVKTRRTNVFGGPIEAVVGRKAHRLRHLAAMWLATTDSEPLDVRFDVVGVIVHRSGVLEIEHLRGAF